MPNPDPPIQSAPEGDDPVDTSAPATQSADGPRGEPKTETAPDTGELLRQAELKAQEHHDAWLRAKAEADNIRKRTQIELANAYKYGDRVPRRRAASRQGQSGSDACRGFRRP